MHSELWDYGLLNTGGYLPLRSQLTLSPVHVNLASPGQPASPETGFTGL